MTNRNLIVAGIVALVGVLAFSADASALGKRKKSSSCSSCTAPVSTGCAGCSVAVGGHAVAPEAMPAIRSAQSNQSVQPGVIVPAAGTDGGGVVPAGGTSVVPQGAVIQAGAVTTYSNTTVNRRGAIRR